MTRTRLGALPGKNLEESRRSWFIGGRAGQLRNAFQKMRLIDCWRLQHAPFGWQEPVQESQRLILCAAEDSQFMPATPTITPRQRCKPRPLGRFVALAPSQCQLKADSSRRVAGRGQHCV